MRPGYLSTRFQWSSGNRALSGESTGGISSTATTLFLIAISVAPRVSAFRLAMTDKIENFNLPFPCSLTLENFFHRNGFDVKRFATMRRADGIFKLRNLFRRHPLKRQLDFRYSCGSGAFPVFD